MKTAVNRRSKRDIAEKELLHCGTSLAMCFQESESVGILLATKNKNEANRWLMYQRPRIADGIGISKNKFNEQGGVGCIFAGIGNYGELRQLFEHFKGSISEELQYIGPTDGMTESALVRLTDMMSDEFRSADYERPYVVEVIVTSMLENNFRMFRIKYDGDFHPAVPYCVIGGYTKRRERSIRNNALELCRMAYAKHQKRQHLPSFKEVRALAKKILCMETVGEYKDLKIFYGRTAN